MEIVDIYVYPVKSVAGREVENAVVEPWGLAGDRRWAVVDPDGEKITGRQAPRLLTVTAIPGDDTLTLTAPGMPAQAVKPGGAETPVRFSRLDRAIVANVEADRWISALLDRRARLVWLDDPRRRAVSERRGGLPGEAVSLADAAPLLLTSTSSLARLNDWIAEGAVERGAEPPAPLSMRRFRPNLVVDSDEPFAEDSWSRISVGEVGFRVLGPCDRCVFTTIDPDTLEKGKEPIRTLARHRKWDGKTWFGVWLVPSEGGEIKAGDPVGMI